MPTKASQKGPSECDQVQEAETEGYTHSLNVDVILGRFMCLLAPSCTLGCYATLLATVD